MSSIIKGINRESSLPAPSTEFRVNVPGFGSLSLESLKSHVKALSKEFNELIQTEEFIKAAHKTEQFYNALFALAKAMKTKTDSSMKEGYRAGAAGGTGLDIEKSPMEKVLEKPLGEHIGSPGGMGQAYRKFKPKTSDISEGPFTGISKKLMKNKLSRDIEQHDKDLSTDMQIDWLDDNSGLEFKPRDPTFDWGKTADLRDRKAAALARLNRSQGMTEDASKLHIGDRVIITGNVEFQGEKGDIENFDRLKAFVVVHLDNYGSRSFHSSDVSSYDDDEYQESAIMKGLNRE